MQPTAVQSVDAAQAVLDSLKSKGAVTDRLVLDTLNSAQGARHQKLLDSGKFDAMFHTAEQTDEFSADDVRLSMALASLATDDLGIDEILNITMEDLPDVVEWEADNDKPQEDGVIRPRSEIEALLTVTRKDASESDAPQADTEAQ